jgi:hypothetical protein
MISLRTYLVRHWRLTVGSLLLAIAVVWLLVYRLGSLSGGISSTELSTANSQLGWHGLYHQAFNLPLNVVRSAVFLIIGHHGQLLTRLPNVCFGLLTMLAFVCLIRMWHGSRTAVFGGALFITSAWVLHASRLASNDVLYLWAVPTLLLLQAALQRRPQSAWLNYGSLIIWGLMLYIPGLIWLLLINFYWQRQVFRDAWQYFGEWWQRLLYSLAGLIWLPLLIRQLFRAGSWRAWLGLPQHFGSLSQLVKQFAGVPAHSFIRGPQYPQIWLGRAPILDIFALAVCLIGIYFYATHWQAARSRLLGIYALVGFILVGLGGPVGLSLLIPLLYIMTAAGIAYLLREWLQVFPFNPFGRAAGLTLLTFVLALSCLYNLRAYFVAWPHDAATKAAFHYRLR